MFSSKNGIIKLHSLKHKARTTTKIPKTEKYFQKTIDKSKKKVYNEPVNEKRGERIYLTNDF